jgi:tetratricopeptide (TPR) repeat protein
MKRFNKARAEFQSNNLSGAEKDLEKAVQIDPKFADAWYQLGKLQQAKNSPDALGSYQKAAGDDPKFISPYEHIAEESAVQKKWPDVLNATAQALKLDPAGTPQIWYFDAMGKLNTGDSDGAEVSARKSLAMDPQHLAPNTEQLLAVILAGKGELAEALKHLQNSLTYVKPGPNADMIKQQIAQLQKAMRAGSN